MEWGIYCQLLMEKYLEITLHLPYIRFMSAKQNATSQITLSESDVRRLLEDKSADSRAEISSKIAGSYSNESLSPNDCQIAEQIFRLLLNDTEVKVRASLANSLKESTLIPRDIVMSMAHDISEVSLPILEFSQVLSDSDLLDIIHSTQENAQYMAISRRSKVSEEVSDSLVNKGDDNVVESLLNNKGALISENGFTNIINIHKENPALMEAVTARAHLPISTVEKLVNVVSSSIADSLKQKYKLPSEHIQKEVEKNRESETLYLLRSARSHEEVSKLIAHLRDANRLTPSIILSALCQGNFDFFESSLAALSNIQVENARTLIADRGELGFRAIYNKSGLPDAMFPAVKLLLKIVRELDNEGEHAGSSRYSNRIVERILQYSEETPVENLSYIIALVRRVAQ
jgi:uncharacterized protein (DUF2336 family)